ncbi:hypothetical protein Tsubulata_043392 [Turnera subulata]|uniref:SHSP domain-containing protein n=1 Tax=Turnera subulata TaxID=218843 RepID=A0A9Q0G697_9ROSI|nr:hypothetical protein Tsubulata_043392 [Turnera subulata]
MATRTRTVGSTVVQYEDFVPRSEWKEEEGANILHIHLPGFQKEQMKITYVHSSRTIRVLGERPVINNKWKRFNKVFPVPQNCEVSKIQGRFQDGVLIITMPKSTITQAVPKEEVKTTSDASTPSRTAPSPRTTATEPKAGKVVDETTSLSRQKQMEGKKVEEKTPTPKGDLKEPKPQKAQDDASQKVSADAINQKTEKTSAVPSAAVADQKRKETTEKTTEPALQKPLLQQEEISKKRKEPLTSESEEGSKKSEESAEIDKKADPTTSQNKPQKAVKFGASEEKPIKDSIIEKAKGVKDRAAAAAKNTVKGFNMELTEERKSMVNVGVAVLVIVALGAYIAYSYRSSGSTGTSDQ